MANLILVASFWQFHTASQKGLSEASPAHAVTASTAPRSAPPAAFLVFWLKAAPHLFANRGQGPAGLGRPETQQIVADAGIPLRCFYSIPKGTCPIPQPLQAGKGRGGVPVLQIRRLSKLLV